MQIHYHTFHALFYRLLSCLLLAFSMLMHVGSFINFILSIYDKSLVPGSSFVALLWTFSIAILCFILYGYHTATA